MMNMLQSGVDVAQHVIPAVPQIYSTITSALQYYHAQKEHPEYIRRFVVFLTTVKEQVPRIVENSQRDDGLYSDTVQPLLTLVKLAELAIIDSYKPYAVAKMCQDKIASIQVDIEAQLRLITFATTQSAFHVLQEIRQTTTTSATTMTIVAKESIDVAVVESDSSYPHPEHVDEAIQIAKSTALQVLSKDTVQMKSETSGVSLAKFNFRSSPR